MSYATLQDMVTRFGEGELLDLTDIEGTGQVDETKVDEALADAASLIDGYVGRRERLPLDPVPTALTRVACDIARHALFAHRATEEVENRKKAAMQFLRDIADDKVTLGQEAPATSVADTPVINKGRQVFTDSDLEGY